MEDLNNHQFPPHNDDDVYDNQIARNNFVKVDNPEILLVQVILKHHEVPREEIDFKLQIHRERDMVDIFERVSQWLNGTIQIPFTGFRLFFKNRCL